jgi:hypothetical protein
MLNKTKHIVTYNKEIKLTGFMSSFYENYIHIGKSNNGLGYTLNFNLTFDISKKVFAGFYMLTPFSRRITPQGYTTNDFKINQLYIGLKVFNDKGKLYLIAFNLPGDNNTVIIDYSDYKSQQRTYVKSITAGIYFTYSFFKGKDIRKIDREYNMEKDDKSKF